MSTRSSSVLLAVATAVVVIGAGCGSGAGGTTASKTDTKAEATHVSIAALRVAVRAAIRADRKVSLYVLWHNRVPTWATRSTRGPALKALVSAAASRRQQSIRIKNLSDTYAITAITLAPSYAAATAIVRSHQRVAPYRSGRRLGKAISENDRARVELRRVGDSGRFVVWRLTSIT